MKLLSIIFLNLALSALAQASYFQTVCTNDDNSIAYYTGQSQNQVEFFDIDKGKQVLSSDQYQVVVLEQINVSRVCTKNSWVNTYVAKLVFSSRKHFLHGKNGLFVCKSKWNDRNTRCD